jgi:hypothetical protein
MEHQQSHMPADAAKVIGIVQHFMDALSQIGLSPKECSAVSRTLLLSILLKLAEKDEFFPEVRESMAELGGLLQKWSSASSFADLDAMVDQDIWSINFQAFDAGGRH